MSVAVVAAASAIVGAGRFATLNAQVRNPSNTFATGTIVLSD